MGSASIKNKSKSYMGLYQYAATFTALFAVLSCGFTSGWPSPSLPKLLRADSEIPITDSEGSWLAIINTTGSMFSCVLCAFLANTIGRKWTLILSSVIAFTGWITIAFSQSFVMLMCGRFITGLLEGFANMTFAMYVGEIAHPNIRGLLLSFHPLTTNIGFLLINILGSYLTIKTTALVCSCFSVIHIITFWSMPESPYLLLMRGQQDKARRSLKKLRGIADVNLELDRLQDALTEQTKSGGKFSDLFHVKSNRKAMFITFVFLGATAFCGAVAIGNYLQIIFQEAEDVLSSVASSNIYISISITSSLLSSILVDKCGRKPLLIISSLGSFFALAALGIFFYIKEKSLMDLSNLSYLPVMLLFILIALFSIGLLAIPIIITAELYPTNVKSYAYCLINIFFCICCTLLSKFFQASKDNYGLHVPLFCFSICCLLTTLIVIFIIPETKRKTLEEIQDFLKNAETAF